MKPHLVIITLLLIILACQVIPTPPPLANPPNGNRTPRPSPTTTPLETPRQPIATTALPDLYLEIISPGELQPFPASVWGMQFPGQPDPVLPDSIQDPGFDLPISLSQVANRNVTAGLTNNQRAALSQEGVLVLRTAEAQFSDIRNRVSLRQGQPYFLTSDAAFHAFRLSLGELLKDLEKEQIHPRLIQVTRLVLDEVLGYLPVIQDENLLKDARLAVAYLAVGLKLLEPLSNPSLEPDLDAQVVAQIDQIMSAQGLQASILTPYFVEDFSIYQPVGHYANDPQLEAYYRGMSWFRRFQFKLVDRDPRFVPSKAPLIITMALRRASSPSQTAFEDWAVVNDTLAYLLGEGDDYGPRQYASMMDQIYGRRVSILGLSVETLWLTFQGLNQAFPYIQVGSPFTQFLINMNRNRSWKFIANRFALDEIILQSMVYDRVGTLSSPRQMPSGLDLMAVLGSPAAIEALEKSGAMNYQNFPVQMEKLQAAVHAQPESLWSSSLIDEWLHLLSSQLVSKTGGYPHFMQTRAWDYKELNSALGSWVAVLHDPSFTSKSPETAASQALPASPPAPAFVEPNPIYFYRLANQAEWIVEGLKSLGLSGRDPQEALGLSNSLSGLMELAAHFQELGKIAEKELRGSPLGADDYRLIQAPLGPVEQRALSGLGPGLRVVSQAQEMPPLPVVATLQANAEKNLQVGIGFLNRIYVIVPLEGRLQIAQGGIFSYYEFPQPIQELVTDGRWRRNLLTYEAVQPPAWTKDFLSQEDGYAVDVLAFRVGDIYRITHAGGRLNIREAPSIGSIVLKQLPIGMYVAIVDGPVQADGFTWWKLRTDPIGENHLEGWAVENAAWYERAWGH